MVRGAKYRHKFPPPINPPNHLDPDRSMPGPNMLTLHPHQILKEMKQSIPSTGETEISPLRILSDLDAMQVQCTVGVVKETTGSESLPRIR
jgi:hypothetical protein